MTKYDFTTLPNRLTHHTYKWKETETDPEIIPAWIADMDFNVIPEVREAVRGEKLTSGFFVLSFLGVVLFSFYIFSILKEIKDLKANKM